MIRERAGDLITRVVPYLAYAYMTLVGLTTRLRVEGLENLSRARSLGPRVIYACWHERQVFFTYSHRGAGASVLVSRSRDGELIARTMELSGIHASRGSSSRGGEAALRAMTRLVQAGLDLGFTPDGPKGPRREVKPGVLYLAQKQGIPIIPITNALSRRLVLRRSWDHYQVPLPFGRGVVRYGEPILVGAKDDLAAKAAELKAELDRITDSADREAAG